MQCENCQRAATMGMRLTLPWRGAPRSHPPMVADGAFCGKRCGVEWAKSQATRPFSAFKSFPAGSKLQPIKLFQVDEFVVDGVTRAPGDNRPIPQRKPPQERDR